MKGNRNWKGPGGLYVSVHDVAETVHFEQFENGNPAARHVAEHDMSLEQFRSAASFVLGPIAPKDELDKAKTALAASIEEMNRAHTAATRQAEEIADLHTKLGGMQVDAEKAAERIAELEAALADALRPITEAEFIEALKLQPGERFDVVASPGGKPALVRQTPPATAAA